MANNSAQSTNSEQAVVAQDDARPRDGETRREVKSKTHEKEGSWFMGTECLCERRIA